MMTPVYFSLRSIKRKPIAVDPDSANTLIRRSWSLAIADKDSLARIFYSKLFEIAPDTQALFKNDLNQQGKKLVATLGFIVDSLDEPETLMDAAAALAIRHVDYNVSQDQYKPVGDALVYTLEELLADRFDQETREAWCATYAILSNHMVESAYPNP